MLSDRDGANWTGCGCLVLCVLGIAAVLALGAWKKHASPQRTAEVCR